LFTGILLAAGPATADVVTLRDGSRLIGTVVRMQDGKLTLETQFAGTIEIDASMVTSVATDQPVSVGMDTGDRLVGPMAWKPEIERAVVETAMGGVPVEVARISAIWPQGAKSPETLAMEEQIAQVRKEVEKARAQWTWTLEAGVTLTDGNSDTLEARGGTELVRKSADDLLRFYLTGQYAEQNDERSASEVIAGMYYEYMLTRRFFAYARGELEYDEFENLDLRLSTGPGIGYYWIKQDEHELKNRVGVGYLHESYMDGTTVDTGEMELGLDYRVDLATWLRFKHGTTWYPTFDGLDDYRLVSDSAFIVPLGDSEMWKLKLGAKYEYKSQPNRSRERLDQTYYANILVEVK
jgi:putative salt-induced outer membrane protein YdiY